MPVVLELERWLQKNGIIKAILGYIMKSRPVSKMKQTPPKNLGWEEMPYNSLHDPKILGALPDLYLGNGAH